MVSFIDVDFLYILLLRIRIKVSKSKKKGNILQLEKLFIIVKLDKITGKLILIATITMIFLSL